jgi:hypothetical protein
MSRHRPSNGNGKMTPGAFKLRYPQAATRAPLGIPYDRMQSAVGWLKMRRERGHVASCQCVRCNLSRTQARDAVRYTDCDCGTCLRCWAADEIRAGRL